jgi:hypothetical protein
MSRRLASLLAVGAFSAAALSSRPAVAASLASLGVVLLWLETLDAGPSRGKKLGIWAGGVGLLLILFIQFDAVGPVPQSVRDNRPLWVGLLVIASICVAMSDRGRLYRRLALTAALTAVVAVTALGSVSDWDSPGGFDVYQSHQAAGDALADGENPYGDAVQVANGNPFAPEGSTIVGYSYPPIVVATYGLVATFVDPRVVSTVGWLVVVGWFALLSLKRRDRAELNLSLFLLLAIAPVWPVVWYAGWTEPLSLALLLASALMWKDRPIVSAIILGLALASKQYFVLLVPLLFLHRGDHHTRRALIATGTAAATLVPALLVDAPSFLQATIGNLANIGFRPDSQSLSGLLADVGVEFTLPVAVWVAASLLFAAVVGRKSRSPADFYLYGAVILGFSFLIGQAFPNYWFLVMGLAAIGGVLKHRELSSTLSSQTSPVI